MAATPAVEVYELVVRYGSLTAVNGVSFTAEPAAVTVVLGPNGAGKTSTIESLEGYRRPASGRLRVLGLDPLTDHARLTRRVGVMLQQGGVYPGIKVAEAVRLFCSYYDNAPEPAALLALVGLTDRARSTWKQLSGGEQQRLSLALALAGRPEVAFLDEPTAGVDVAGRQVVRQVIRDLATGGCAVILATHELDEAERLADHVVIIDQGKVVADAPREELLSGGGTEEVLFSAAPGLDLVALGAAVRAPVTEPTPGQYRVGTAATPQVVAALTAWLAAHDLPLADLRAGRQRLEDVFLRLTGSGNRNGAASSTGGTGTSDDGRTAAS